MPDETNQRLADLIEYVDHVVRLGEKPVFSVRQYGQLAYYEHELKGRIGISHDVSSDEDPVWLKIERLKRKDPPPLPEALTPWVTVSRDPFSPPQVEDHITRTISREEAERHITEGLLAEDDVLPAMRPPADDEWKDAIFRLGRQMGVQEAIEQYRAGPWLQWSESEKPRRESMRIYDAFFSLQQSIEIGAAEKPLEVVWGMGVALWKKAGRTIDRPLIEQLVEIEIDSTDGSLTIKPRSAEPKVALEPYFELGVPGAREVFSFSRTFFQGFREDQDFSPYLAETYQPLLRQAATHLDQNGHYFPDSQQDLTDRRLPPASDNLTVTDRWVVFARRRSDNFYRDDLRRLKEAAQECEALPGPAKRLVTEPGNEPAYREGCIGIGAEVPAGHGVPSTPTFYFPKPYNKEQISIIGKLEQSDGMVVQGPPGTGKTHTIANIICHYLATGRRVLVTSKGEAALTVLREHIPEDIRDLTISLLTNEKEGLKQLEAAVRILSSTAAQTNPAALEREIKDVEGRIQKLRERVATIDDLLQKWAERHLRPVGANQAGEGVLPMDLAKRVVEQRDLHTWFNDKPTSRPGFPDGDIARVRESRKRIGPDLDYLSCILPSVNDLPDGRKISAIHQDLSHAANIEAQAAGEQLPALSVTETRALERAGELLRAVRSVAKLHKMAEATPWIKVISDLWRTKGENCQEIRLFNALLPNMQKLCEERLEVVGYAVEVPGSALETQGLQTAVERAANGQKPFPLVPFGKSEARQAFRQVRVEGSVPDSPEAWERVRKLLEYRRQVVAFTSRWNAVAPEYGLPPAAVQEDPVGVWIGGAFDKIKFIKDDFLPAVRVVETEIPRLFPFGMNPSQVLASAQEASRAATIIETHLAKNQLLASKAHLDAALERLARCSGPITEHIEGFLRETVGDPSTPATDLLENWRSLCVELQRLHDLQPDFACLKRVAGLVKESGAPKWARLLLTQPVVGSEDPCTPGGWRHSWAWAVQEQYLRRIDGRSEIRHLAKERLRKESDMAKAYQRLVKLKTDLGLKKSLTERVESALVQFMAAIARIGRGTGIRARRFRRDARQAMERCYSAVPCWIMPSWRVSESLPPELGSFDLVIVDEASQSDITALPVLLRGKKLLVVGDDKQVSPTGAFIEEARLLQLRHNYLESQPFAPLLLPGGSLYDLANAIFPGQRIMLREHFRCVEPIIRFSMRFYPESLVPLRVPKASERLDPPLIDAYVPHGRKNRGQINEHEAEAIVQEVVRIVEDSSFTNRSIGVVSLIGGRQAQHIQTLLLGRIGEDAFLKHKIVCGDSAAFQGKERDIMFVSMVECPRTTSARTSRMYEQRFNVALSRARDRMYLYRSVTEEMLNPADLKAKVIRHFFNPMATTTDQWDGLIALCESDFERDVFQRLVALGYRVKPQVKVGPYSIDLVVEGQEDRRLAVELDGDRYHTPDRWADDYTRQRVLERVGWRFWRCWGSSFTLDPEGCMQDLVSTLSGLAIEPVGN